MSRKPQGAGQEQNNEFLTPIAPDRTFADRDWWRYIPVAVNDTYGDPFIIEQIRNTLDKTDRLMTQRTPIAIFTKAPLDARVIPYLRGVATNPMVIPFYSLTGLGEGGYDLSHRHKMIRTMNDIFGDVVTLTRPIIAGRNDDPGTLAALVEISADTDSLMVLGGIHDARKRKRLDHDVEGLLLQMCEQAGVRAFHKSSCLGAYMYGLDCWTHDMQEPVNLDVAAALGYRLARDDIGRVLLDRASTGDLNFLRILTRAPVHARRIISNYNLLTLPSGGHKYECTSSWMAWSKNIDTCIGCNYCIILQIEYLRKNLVAIGTHPRDMIPITALAQASTEGERPTGDDNAGSEFTMFRKTKLPADGTGLHTYADVRVVKPCRRHEYPPYTRLRTTPEVP